MVEITNREELKAWLRNRPHEDAVLIAARAALRFFPVVDPIIPRNHQERRATKILPVCRAIAIARVAGTWPTQAITVRDAAHAAANTTTAHVADVSAASAYAAAATAASSAYAAIATAADFAVAALAATDADSFTDADAYAALSNDATALEQGTGHAAISNRPLWCGRPLRFLGMGRIGTTDKPPDIINRAWVSLRSHLNSAGDDWQVWTDWYQDRLDGKPGIEALEVAKALIPNEIWEAGPAVVNAEIARLIQQFEIGETDELEEAEVVEDEEQEQNELASQSEFAPPDPEPAPVRLYVDDGVLRLHGNETAPLADFAEVGWAVLCQEIDDLTAQLGSQNNDLRPRLVRARNALGATLDDFSAIRFGLAALTIEQFAQEAENLGMLMPEQAAPLRSIVLQKNLLLRHAPEWADYVADLEPEIADAETEQDAARLAAEIARAIAEEYSNAIAPDTAEALDELVVATEVEPTPDNPDGIASPEDRRSWLRAFSEEMRAFAVDIVTEGRKLAIKGIAATSVAVITSVSTKLLGLADKLPAEYAWLKDLVYYAAALVGA